MILLFICKVFFEPHTGSESETDPGPGQHLRKGPYAFGVFGSCFEYKVEVIGSRFLLLPWIPKSSLEGRKELLGILKPVYFLR